MSLSCGSKIYPHLEWIKGFRVGREKKNKDHLIRCQDRINKHKEKTHKETDTLVQMSSFKTLHRASNKSSSHFLTQTKKSTKKKRVKQPLYAKASPGGRRNTMYSDIVVFFPLIFRTTVHTSAPYLSLFFYRCLEKKQWRNVILSALFVQISSTLLYL